MDLERVRVLLSETARALDEISAELRAALYGSNPIQPKGCGCQEITVEREAVTGSLLIRCDQGRETRTEFHYAQMLSMDVDRIIQRIAQQVAEEHGLDVQQIARALHNSVVHRDGMARLKIR